MKRTLLLILLLTISIGSVYIFASSVYEEHDNVAFKETVLYGDRSAADGLTLTLKTHQASQLFWDTLCEFNDHMKVATEYSFYAQRQNDDYSAENGGISFMCDSTSFVAWPNGIDDTDKQYGLSKAYTELFDSLLPGEEKERTIYLKDYIDYYDFDIGFDFPNCSTFAHTQELYYSDSSTIDINSTQKALVDLKKYFKIPVLETEQLTISIGKHENGHLATLGSGSTDGEHFSMETHSVLTADTCYFTFNPYTSEGNLVDLSELPEGFGIFALPYETASDDVSFGLSTVKTDQLSMVYPLDVSTELFELELDETKSKLYLYTFEEKQLWLTIIDIATMNTHQKISLIDVEEDMWISTYRNENFLVVFNYYSEELSVFCLNEAHEFELHFTCNYKPKDFEDTYWYPSIMTYDGERLAGTGTLRGYTYGNHNYCDFYIVVYTKDGLQYKGQYDNSLDSGLDGYQYDYPCRSDRNLAIDISW